MCKIEGGDKNYALSAIIQVFLEIDEFRRYYTLEKRPGQPLFYTYSRIFEAALKENSQKMKKQEMMIEDDVDVENENQGT